MTPPRLSTGRRTLVVHGNPIGAAALVRWLSSLGAARVEAVTELSPAGLAAVLPPPKRPMPDLIVVDCQAFTAQGMAALSADARLADVPVVVIGRFAGLAQRQAVLDLGAADVLVRPLGRGEVVRRLALLLENRALNRSMKEVIRSLQTFHHAAVVGMKSAREMQTALLPDAAACREIEARYGVRLDAHFESSSELGGDLWGARPLDDRRFTFFLCDFTGHGVAAAMNTFRLHALMSRMDLPGDDPAAMLERVNRLLVGLLPETHFATMIYGVVDVRGGSITYATAGSPRPMTGTATGGVLAGHSVGLPLGITANARYSNRSLALEPGGFLFLFSDALFEARDWEGQPFGYDAVMDLVRTVDAERGGKSRLEKLLERYFAVMPRPLADDLTAVWISRPGR